MIKVKGISKKYGNRIIFENISCSLDNQRIYALVGVNGIGKSTLLNAITQPASMDSGNVEIDGIDNREFKSKFQFFYVPDSKEMFLNLTGNEYLRCIIQQVYLIAAFLSGAGNLILDEPFNGLDPESVATLKKLLIEHRDAGNLVLFSAHNLDLVANFCDDVVFIDKHRKIFQLENPRDFAQLESAFFQNCVSDKSLTFGYK